MKTFKAALFAYNALLTEADNVNQTDKMEPYKTKLANAKQDLIRAIQGLKDERDRVREEQKKTFVEDIKNIALDKNLIPNLMQVIEKIKKYPYLKDNAEIRTETVAKLNQGLSELAGDIS